MTLRRRIGQRLGGMVLWCISPDRRLDLSLRFSLLFLAILFAFVLLLSTVGHLGTSLLEWYASKPTSADESGVLAVEASIGAVAWTGALIAFQLRGPSFQISGAFLLLGLAAVVPILGLLSNGAILRAFALCAFLYFLGRIAFQGTMVLVIRAFGGRLPDPSNATEKLARRLWPVLARGISLPATYAAICALVSVSIVAFPTSVTVAWATLILFVSGLKLVIDTLSPVQREQTSDKAHEVVESMIGSLKTFIEEHRSDTPGSPPP